MHTLICTVPVANPNSDHVIHRRPLSATVSSTIAIATQARAATSVVVTIEFELQPGSGGLSLNTSAVCTPVVLGVYCPRDQRLGFEVQLSNGGQPNDRNGEQPNSSDGGAWVAPTSVVLSADKSSVLLTVAVPTDSARASTPVARVRYAYADWPVVSLRNAIGGLPARLFDIAIAKKKQ